MAQQIINHRPYSSFQDFFNKHSYEGSPITKTKFIQLIKAGCFDEFNPNRKAIMKELFSYLTPTKTTLTLANIDEIKRIKLHLPSEIISPYNFKKYVCSKQFFYAPHPKYKSKKLYWLDGKALKYFNQNCKESLKEETDYFYEEDLVLVVDTALDKLFKPTLDRLKAFINAPEFIQKYNSRVAEYNLITTLKSANVNHWSFEACSYYSNEHELACVNKSLYNITPFDEIPSEPIFETKKMGKREWKQYELYRIAGTVIDRKDSHHLITILDINNNVINCKFDGSSYAFYKQQLSEYNHETNKKNVIETSWLRRGQPLILTGYRVGDDDFRIKTYKNSVYQHKVQRINNIYPETGELDIQSIRAGYEE